MSAKPDDGGRKRAFTLLAQRRNLPIFGVRSEIVDLVRQSASLVLVAETGSGKTTQVPQFLLASGLAGRGCIAVTQPRRVAAVSVAQRVAHERNVKIGQEVGYAVRFDDKSVAATRIKYLTDGMLLREALLDPLLRRYKVVIIDEAHERTAQSDLLLGLLKAVVRKRPADLKLVVMSATLDAEKFSTFLECSIAFVQGRQFPVQCLYTAVAQESYVDAALATVLQLHAEQGPGDVLVFLTGQEEIEAVQRLLLDRVSQGEKQVDGGSAVAASERLALHVVTMFAALPPERQAAVFQPTLPGTRKVILATNIAETSITVPGVRFVVDSGFVKARSYSAAKGADSLRVVPVSRAQASQRSGRAGREAPGKAFRLYPESSFKALPAVTAPEILRSNLASVVLQLKALGVNDVLSFDYLDRPPTAALARALEQLLALGALDAEGRLTEAVGRPLARLPLEPMQGAILLAAARSGCLPHALAVVAMAATDPVSLSPRGDNKTAVAARRRFTSSTGDHATARNIFQAFVAVPDGERKGWCKALALNHRALSKAAHIREQLAGLMASVKPVAEPAPASSAPEGSQRADTEPEADEALRRALIAGLFCHAALLQPDGTFKLVVSGQTVSLHPSSVLCGTRPSCIIFDEQLHTSRPYARSVSLVQPAWLPQVVPTFFAQRLAAGA